MDILFLLVPLSVLLALAIMAVLAWAVWSGQFEDMEREGQRIFQDDEVLQSIRQPQHDTKA
jgi:cbb3-type cytochrome oxidase maturation protein